MKKIYLLFLIFLNFCQSFEKTTIKKIELENLENYKKSQELLKKANSFYDKKDYINAIQYSRESLNYQVSFDAYYILGLSYFQINQTEESLSFLEKAESIKPNHQQVLLTSGLIYMSLAKYEIALEKFRKLYELHPDDPVYQYRLGLSYKSLGDYSNAIQFLEKAEKSNFTFKENVLLNLADIYFELKDYEKSSFYYDELKKIKPDLEEVQQSKQNVKIAKLLEKGNQFFNRRMYKDAEEIYKKIIEKYPSEKIGYIQLGLLKLYMNQYKEAIQNFNKAISFSRDNDTFLFLCRSYLEAQMFNESKGCLDKSLSLYPVDSALLNLLSIYYKKIGNRKLSYSVLNKVLKNDQRNINANKNIYLLYLEDGKIHQAKEHIEILKEIDKQNLSYWGKEEKRIAAYEYVNSGNELLFRRNFNKAKNHFQKALNLYEDAITLIAMGNFFDRIKNQRLAEEYYLKAKRLEKHNIIVYETLLNFYKQAPNQKKFKQIEREILLNSNTDLSFGILFGVLMMEKKDYVSAIKYFEGLKKRYPDDKIINERIALSYYYLAQDSNRKKNFNAAIHFIKKALEWHPENQLYKESYDILLENQKYAKFLPQLEEAEKLYDRGEYDKAKNIYENLYKNWKKPMILVRLSEIEFQKGNIQKGRKLLEDSLKDKPKEIVIREAIYARLIEEKNYEEAEKGFQDILQINSDAYYSYYKLGIISLLKKQYNKAIEYFDDAILYNSNFLPSYLAKGISLYFLKQEEEAKKMFKLASRKDNPGKELALLNLILIELNKDNEKLARNELKKLIQMFPEFSDAYYHLSYLEYLEKNYLLAEELLIKAIQIRNDDLYYWALIQLYLKMPQRKNQLKQTLKYFVQNFNQSSYYEEVKEILRKQGETFFIESSYRGTLKDFKILSFMDLFFIYNDKEITVVKSNTEQILYRKNINSIIDVVLSSFLFVLSKNQFYIFEPLTGNLVKEISNSKEKLNCKMKLNKKEIYLLQSKDCQKIDSIYLVNKNQTYNFDFLDIYFSENYVYLLSSKLFRLPRKEFLNFLENPSVQKLELFLELPLNIKQYLFTNHQFVAVAPTKIFIYSESLDRKEINLDTPFTIYENFIIQLKVPQNIHIFDLKTHKNEKVNLPEPITNPGDFAYLGQNQYIFIDSKQNLNYIKENKILFKKSLNGFLSGIFTFYY